MKPNKARYINNIPSDINDNLRKYLTNFDYQSLSNKTARELIIKYRNGDTDALIKLVKGYMSLLIKIAKSFNIHGVAFEDLIQEGFFSLKYAIDHYEHGFFYFFYKYVGYCVRQSKSNSLITLKQVVSYPNKIKNSYKKIWRYVESFEEENGYLPSINDIVDNVIDDYDLVYEILNLPPVLEESTLFVEDVDIYENETNNIEEYIDIEYNKYLAQYLLEQLSDRENYILSKYYGLEGTDSQDLNMIGDRLGLTRERVRQILGKSILKLQEVCNNIINKVPLIDDCILLGQSQQIGKVINIKKANDGTSILVLRMETGFVEEVNVKNKSFLILPRKIKHNNEVNEHEDIKEKDKEKHVELNIYNKRIEVNELDGLKVGDIIKYNFKFARVYKIIIKGKSSRLLIVYKNGILTYIPNDKSKYKIVK